MHAIADAEGVACLITAMFLSLVHFKKTSDSVLHLE